MRTEHELVRDTRDYNPRGRGLYRCLRCGRVRSMRHLRPSSEVSYWTLMKPIMRGLWGVWCCSPEGVSALSPKPGLLRRRSCRWSVLPLHPSTPLWKAPAAQLIR